jgi:hypothetical protein
MKPGYLYVLVHPSDPDLYKIGVSTRRPEARLAEHNRDKDKFAGQIVQETGQDWELKTYIAVADPYWAERAFWGATPVADMPYRAGVEVEKLDWQTVQKGLAAAREAGARPEPAPRPEWEYAYTASMRRRLGGRGISLLGHVRSMSSGKANFRCENGHEWRTRALHVGEGQGCPECGLGERDPEEIRRRIGAGIICLLTNPYRPGFVKIGLGHGTLYDLDKEAWGNWRLHLYRNVEEVALAESLIWDLLGKPLPHDREPIEKDLNEAEDAFRKLTHAIQEELALEERRREGNGTTSALESHTVAPGPVGRR